MKLYPHRSHIFGDVSKRGRLRVLPVVETASKKEWQRSKFGEPMSSNKFWVPQQGITGLTGNHKRHLAMPYRKLLDFSGSFGYVQFSNFFCSPHQLSPKYPGATDVEINMETYRSGHNGADSKSVCRKRHVGSNPTVSAKE